jgi:phage portal protein BeeE
LRWSGGGEPAVRLYFDPMRGRQVHFAVEDLAHLRFRNWGRYPWLGLPPLLAIADSIGLGIAARALASSEFRSGTSIKGVLQTMRDRWQRAFAGSEAAWQTPVLEEGLSCKEISSRDLAALQLAELSRLNSLEVCTAFNVPPSSVGRSSTILVAL